MRKTIQKYLHRKSDAQSRPLQNVVVNRTAEGTVFEVVAAVAMVALWAGVAYIISQSGGRPIPTHFDLAGRPDSYGSPYWLLLVGGVGTGVSVFYLLAAYHPTTWISVSFPLTTMRQVKCMVRWARLMAVEMPLLCLTLALGGVEMLSPLLKLMIFVVMATCLGGLVAIRAAK